ncbi:unnamed protein product [Peniophora sp. CBMAI 1063]|nr:unnamed protein product [Peniophora sp. CBMAI 1063]
MPVPVKGPLEAAPTVTVALPANNDQLDAPYTTPFIKDVRYLGSYDKVEQDLIIIPGSPRIWTPPSVPFTLKPGKAKANRHHRIDPTARDLHLLFTAVDVMGSPISWPDVDIISNRRALRLLLSWVHGSRDAFRIDLQPLGARTLLLCEEKIDFSHQNPGYGVVFENTATTPMTGTERGLEHSRIIQYDFMGLNMVVRYEADARMSTLGRAPDYAPAFTPNALSPKVTRAGEIVAQEDVIEVKSVTTKGRASTCPNGKITDATPQLILSATQRLHVGLHTAGTFYEVEEHLCDEEALLKDRTREVGDMRKLQRVLSTLKEMVWRGGVERRLSIVHGKGELTLGLHERISTESLLPAAYQERFVQQSVTTLIR